MNVEPESAVEVPKSSGYEKKRQPLGMIRVAGAAGESGSTLDALAPRTRPVNLRSLDGSERVHPNREPGGRRGDRPLRLVRGGFHGDRDGVRRVVPARVGVEIPSRRPGLRLCVAERGQPTIRPLPHERFTGGHRCAVLRPRPCAAPGVAESGDAETALGEAAGVASVDRPRQRSHARKPTAQRLPGAVGTATVGTATIDCRWPFGLASCGG